MEACRLLPVALLIAPALLTAPACTVCAGAPPSSIRRSAHRRRSLSGRLVARRLPAKQHPVRSKVRGSQRDRIWWQNRDVDAGKAPLWSLPGLFTLAASMGLGLSLATASPCGAEEFRSFQETPGTVKVLVQGLTDITNAIGGFKSSEDAPPIYRPLILSPEQVRDIIEDDFLSRNYLWTGKLTAGAYKADCTFTDPTLSFTGVGTFQRNLANLTPFIDALIDHPKTVLYNIRLEPGESKIVADWQMDGRLRLPWNPHIKLDGQTIYTLAEASPSAAANVNPGEADRKVLISAYDESWSLSAVDALLQLVTPS